VSNHRVKLVEIYSKCIEQEPLFGIEQEYIMFERDYKKDCKNIVFDDGSSLGMILPKPFKWIKHDEPGSGSQGPYYCSVGGGVCFGREISDTHLKYCLQAGLSICGTNAEVMASQWEYQIGPIGPLDISDQLWVSRYILDKVSEQYKIEPINVENIWNYDIGDKNSEEQIPTKFPYFFEERIQPEQ
jgi:glutamine synthetase